MFGIKLKLTTRTKLEGGLISEGGGGWLIIGSLRYANTNSSVSMTQLNDKLLKILRNTVNSLVSDYPWGTTKWSLTGGGRLRERSTK